MGEYAFIPALFVHLGVGCSLSAQPRRYETAQAMVKLLQDCHAGEVPEENTVKTIVHDPNCCCSVRSRMCSENIPMDRFTHPPDQRSCRSAVREAIAPLSTGEASLSSDNDIRPYSRPQAV